ncbi:hypothetical protein SNE40_001620 [Patella caerulea]|uniref:Reverse transcriptase domain-containing protein n=1 Tax=Patella caerulea TaxID=87958 RepID=A0AAN8KGB5_PATCE
MESLKSAIEMLKPNAYMASIDLKEAFHSINVTHNSRKKLRFRWNNCLYQYTHALLHIIPERSSGFDGTIVFISTHACPFTHNSRKKLRFRWNNCLYQYTCMPFGLISAPRIFNKISKPVLSVLREQGILCVIYINDLYIQADCISDLNRFIKIAIDLLEKLGFTINYEKSSLIPSQIMTFLGFTLNSVEMTMNILKDKALEIIQSQIRVTIRELAMLIDLYVSCMPTVTYGQLHYRHLEMCKISQLNSNGWNFDSFVTLNPKALGEIEWWENHLLGSKKLIIVSKPNFTMQTDSSLFRWGAVCQNKTIGGDWSTFLKLRQF